MNALTRLSRLQAWIWGSAVSAIVACYYFVFYFPPRLVGANDPDRFYHLALSAQMASNGILRTLPQAEDIGWGRYFPDKEFLFHALTGTASWLAGPVGVLAVVPLLGIAIALCLYLTLTRVLSPWRAGVLTSMGLLLSPILIFRLTMLRPHLLAIFCFCLLLAAILRGRAWLAALAAAAFALSYHAFYIPVIVVMVAAAIKWPQDKGRFRTWQWAAGGVIVGIILNPYFPSNLLMSWAHVKIALGIGLPAGLRSGNELLPLGFLEYLDYFGFLPTALIGTTVLVFVRKLRMEPQLAGFWFLFALSTLLVLLSFKSSRATEYAAPCVILLAGYGLGLVSQTRGLWLACLLLLLTQGHSAWTYYSDIWGKPQEGYSGWYLAAVNSLPADSTGLKVFNCEWAAGSYLLFARPTIRFVDLLEPAFLWQASPAKYLARERLISGQDPDPRQTLRLQFDADYVLCAIQPLNRQMESQPEQFEPVQPEQPTGPVRVFRILD